MKNIEIRTTLMKAGMKQYKLAALLNVTETKFSKMLRTELTQQEKDRIIQIIKENEG